MHIALQNYRAEGQRVPALPPVDSVPDPTHFAENGLGVAAFDGDTMVGFLCVLPPFQHAFRSTDAVGVFSPMGANGAVGGDRANIYARMYQAAGEKWVNACASSHALCLYAHDKIVQAQFFRYGFGLRVVDAVRGLDKIPVPPCKDFLFEELPQDEYSAVFPLYLMLNDHQCKSPSFMRREPNTPGNLTDSYRKQGARFFTAKRGGKICAYLKTCRDGETFVSGADGYIHIGGAFCLPAYRGKGIYQNLLNHVLSVLKAEGYTRLGVDFESINPAAYGFWLKYFDAYAYSVVRRIDEHVITKRP